MTRADRIYVVDNDTSARNGLTRLLRTAGHDVRDFALAEDFLVNINSGVGGCLVLDARMPGKTGEELHAELEALEARLTIVVVSAGDDDEVREYGMPKVYNLYKDPQERENVLFPNTWVAKAAMPQLLQHVISLRANPPIKPGTKDPYEPPK